MRCAQKNSNDLHVINSKIIVVALFIIGLSNLTGNSWAAVPQTPRHITQNDWVYKALDSWAQRGLLAGYPEQRLSTPPSLTRFETASLVVRAAEGIGREFERNGQAITQLATPATTSTEIPAPTQEQIQAAERGPGIHPEDIAMLEKLVAEFRIELAGMGTQVDDLMKLLADTRQRLSVIENDQKRHQISGYLQVRFSDDHAKSNSTFSIRRARLSTSGQLSPKASYKIQLQIEGDNGKSVAIRDAYIDLVTGLYSRLRSGQAVIPVGYELTESDPDRIELERSFAMDRLFPDQRDIGIQWRYQQATTAPAYEVALVNGSGVNTTDTNDRKDIIGSVHIPFTWGNASLALYSGKAGTNADGAAKDRLTAGVDVNGKPTGLRVEYVVGKDHGADVEGWYARLSQRMTRTGTAYVKYDTYDENTDRSSDLFRRWTVGWSEQLDSNIRLTLQWEARRIGSDFSDIDDFRGNTTLLQLQAKF